MSRKLIPLSIEELHIISTSLELLVNTKKHFNLLIDQEEKLSEYLNLRLERRVTRDFIVERRKEDGQQRNSYRDDRKRARDSKKYR